MDCVKRLRAILERLITEMEAYNRIRKIGEGAMGCATLVERKKDRKLMVVKEINVKGLSDRDRSEAMQEVEVLKQLQHPNIVCMHEAFLQVCLMNHLRCSKRMRYFIDTGNKQQRNV